MACVTGSGIGVPRVRNLLQAIELEHRFVRIRQQLPANKKATPRRGFQVACKLQCNGSQTSSPAFMSGTSSALPLPDLAMSAAAWKPSFSSLTSPCLSTL